jgi:membrane protease YdiL (CAAX protease family)
MRQELKLMQIEPQPLTPDAASDLFVPPEKRLIAPVWHTILIVVIMLGNSYLTAKVLVAHQGPATGSSAARTSGYLFTIGFELFLFFLVWLGLWLKKFKMRDLIGGRWNSPEDFLIDVGIAIGFWIVALAVLAGLAYALGQVNQAAMNDMKQRIGNLVPRSGVELSIFVSLSIVAGFVEEILFRGYLQRQIGAMAGNAWVGVIVSALIFGGGHGYEGIKNMIRIAVFGAMFGILALWRKSLRPGMMAHAFQDGLAGVGLYFASRMGKF